MGRAGGGRAGGVVEMGFLDYFIRGGLWIGLPGGEFASPHRVAAALGEGLGLAMRSLVGVW